MLLLFCFFNWLQSCFPAAPLIQLKEKEPSKSERQSYKKTIIIFYLCWFAVAWLVFPTFKLQVGHSEAGTNRVFLSYQKDFDCNLLWTSPLCWDCACINETPCGLGMKGKHLMLYTWPNTLCCRGQKLWMLYFFSLCRTSQTVEWRAHLSRMIWVMTFNFSLGKKKKHF